MPPRPLWGRQDQALHQVLAATDQFPAFDVEIGNLGVFPTTNVIYLEIGMGRETLVRMHSLLNRDALHFEEPFPYHPHVTLAQEVTSEQVGEAFAHVQRCWAEWKGARRFAVDTLTFVQNTLGHGWLDLAGCQLPAPSRVSR
jgi:2'-5' RNA ligase